ncbi:phosphoribosylanthranilate isomerase [Natranaerofaba carboxydovora]|uniref:phosphoribosylanthranilate isomerase n=1 Tax=Natranaerofaba carboxydovora TaxID=2742683 RepID=UPI001F133ACA|nr:phosphoribosylanthranilate isomerase [Natranaerofaba carboxydovora]UMZ72607.1 N-(5'-phosphoribosyl)anthranilate isomerase [Natranaerofaba carboxydovora]
MARVKYCGITDLETAKYAQTLGVDALGFVFAKSKRQVSTDKAKEIVGSLGPFVSVGGVFVGESENKVAEIASYCRLDYVQLHGDETESYIKSLCKIFDNLNLNVDIIKAFKVKDESSVSEIIDFASEKYSCRYLSGYLLDAYSKDGHGGTGKTFNWEYFDRVKDNIDKPLILAGGLNPDNIYEALQKTSPYGVDVSSGIESNAKKDKEKMKEFITQVWRWQKDVFR